MQLFWEELNDSLASLLQLAIKGTKQQLIVKIIFGQDLYKRNFKKAYTVKPVNQGA